MRPLWGRRPAIAVLIAAGLVVAASPARAQSADIAEGRAFAETNCASCHATGRQDESPLAEAPPLRDLGKRYPVDSLAEAFAEGIVTGHAGMPEFELEPDMIGSLLAYLKSISE
ncbi:MAG: cytochrome c [Flavobacteriaceae bacterium]